MTRSNILAVIGGLFLFFFAASIAIAQPQTTGTMPITEIPEQYKAITQVHWTALLGFAQRLFWLLAGIQFAWAIAVMVLDKADMQSFVAGLIRQIMFIGFFYALLSNATTWVWAIVDSFIKIGHDGNGGDLLPGDIFGRGVDISAQFLSKISMFSPGDSFGYAVAALVIIFCFSFLAITLVLAIVEATLVVAFGVILLGFGGSKWTSTYVERYLGMVINVGIKIMAIYLMASVAFSITDNWLNIAKNNDTLSVIFELTGSAVVLAAVVWSIPKIISTLIGGSPSMGASDTVSPVMALGTAIGTAAGGLLMGGAKAGSAAANALKGNSVSAAAGLNSGAAGAATKVAPPTGGAAGGNGAANSNSHIGVPSGKAEGANQTAKATTAAQQSAAGKQAGNNAPASKAAAIDKTSESTSQTAVPKSETSSSNADGMNKTDQALSLQHGKADGYSSGAKQGSPGQAASMGGQAGAQSLASSGTNANPPNLHEAASVGTLDTVGSLSAPQSTTASQTNSETQGGGAGLTTAGAGNTNALAASPFGAVHEAAGSQAGVSAPSGTTSDVGSISSPGSLGSPVSNVATQTGGGAAQSATQTSPAGISKSGPEPLPSAASSASVSSSVGSGSQSVPVSSPTPSVSAPGGLDAASSASIGTSVGASSMTSPSGSSVSAPPSDFGPMSSAPSSDGGGYSSGGLDAASSASIGSSVGASSMTSPSGSSVSAPPSDFGPMSGAPSSDGGGYSSGGLDVAPSQVGSTGFSPMSSSSGMDASTALVGTSVVGAMAASANATPVAQPRSEPPSSSQASQPNYHDDIARMKHAGGGLPGGSQPNYHDDITRILSKNPESRFSGVRANADSAIRKSREAIAKLEGGSETSGSSQGPSIRPPEE